MIKIERPDPPPPRYRDPEEPLAGRCMTCGALVSCAVRDSRLPISQFAQKKDHIGAWTDLVSTECPSCGARVFVMLAKELKSLVE